MTIENNGTQKAKKPKNQYVNMHVGAHTECGAANERNREREGAHECEFGLNVLPSLLYLISLMNPKSSTN